MFVLFYFHFISPLFTPLTRRSLRYSICISISLLLTSINRPFFVYLSFSYSFCLCFCFWNIFGIIICSNAVRRGNIDVIGRCKNIRNLIKHNLKLKNICSIFLFHYLSLAFSPLPPSLSRLFHFHPQNRMSSSLRRKLQLAVTATLTLCAHILWFTMWKREKKERKKKWNNFALLRICMRVCSNKFQYKRVEEKWYLKIKTLSSFSWCTYLNKFGYAANIVLLFC